MAQNRCLKVTSKLRIYTGTFCLKTDGNLLNLYFFLPAITYIKTFICNTH